MKKQNKCKCDICKKYFSKELITKECPDCYMKGIEREMKKQNEKHR